MTAGRSARMEVRLTEAERGEIFRRAASSSNYDNITACRLSRQNSSANRIGGSFALNHSIDRIYLTNRVTPCQYIYNISHSRSAERSYCTYLLRHDRQRTLVSLIKDSLFRKLFLQLLKCNALCSRSCRNDIICVKLVNSARFVNSHTARNYNGHTVLRLEFKP